MDDCIEFEGYKTDRGYGWCTYNGQSVGAHRLAYCQAKDIPLSDIDGLVVRHRCDNPPCINPNHLEIGTHAENMLDMKVRKRAAKGEQNAAARLTEENVREILSNFKRRSLEFGCLAFAAKFGVCKKTIRDVIDRKTWSHLAGFEDVPSRLRPPFSGINLHARSGRWRVFIKVGKEKRYVGEFATEDDAKAAQANAYSLLRHAKV